MSITKSFRAALALGVVAAPLALVGCDDAASTPTPAPSPSPVPVGGAAKTSEPAKTPDAAKPAAPAEKKP